ncbi:MAG: O-antigen ligase family protein [Heliobacteriaceae bacterium]|jgi:putative inorganic carbon (HCO3(-)) transporter|nr:O-antigen ligase family protein [Heliobacteriaceae bacterium]
MMFSKYLYENSLFLQHIDKFILVSVLAVFILSLFMPSDTIGFAAVVTIFLTVVKLLTKPAQKSAPNLFELWLLAYFMLVVVSLCGSTLFSLSLHGFMKTVIYLSFYLSMKVYLKDNKDKILWIIAVIGICTAVESIAGLLQNSLRIAEISTWQDVSNLNPEEVMTRVYGTLKPLNPNLLGGYLLAGLPCLFGLGAYFFVQKQYKVCLTGLVLSVLCCAALFATGSRGAYLGFPVILTGIFTVNAKYLWQNYKKVYLLFTGAAMAAVTSAVLCISSLRARFLSIFAMRQDSSNSFRFNVYQSSFEMFKDNWLLGIGVGNMNFREIYGLYMKTGFDALSAYNVFLEIAVESGVFALIAFLGFLALLVKNAIKFIINSVDVQKVIFVSAALVSICAVTVHGLVDTVFFRPQIQFVFWTMAAIISVYQEDLCTS